MSYCSPCNWWSNQRPGVDAGGATCLHIGHHRPSATQADRSASL
jgi:hypothetical protein